MNVKGAMNSYSIIHCQFLPRSIEGELDMGDVRARLRSLSDLRVGGGIGD
jgi:hypothetical protein